MLRALTIATCVALILPLRSFAAANPPGIKGDPAMLKPLGDFVDSFNKAWEGGSVALPSDLFTDDIAVIDLFPPYYWYGKTQAIAWYANIMPKHGDLSLRQHVELGAPLAVSITAHGKPSTTGTGDQAYVVVPAYLTYSSGGKQQSIDGLWAWVLRREGGKWHIAAHSWATTSDSAPDATYRFTTPWSVHPTPQ